MTSSYRDISTSSGTMPFWGGRSCPTHQVPLAKLSSIISNLHPICVCFFPFVELVFRACRALSHTERTRAVAPPLTSRISNECIKQVCHSPHETTPRLFAPTDLRPCQSDQRLPCGTRSVKGPKVSNLGESGEGSQSCTASHVKACGTSNVPGRQCNHV